MRKSMLSMLLAVCLLIPMCISVSAEGLPMKTIDPPGDMTFVRSYPNEGNECIEAVYTVPDDLCAVAFASAEQQIKYYGTPILLCVQFDWAVDDETAFHYDESWDTTTSDAPVRQISGDCVEQSEVLWFAYETDVARCGDAVRMQRTQIANAAQDEDAPSETADVYSFDFDAHKLFVRARFFVYETESGICRFSDWTQAMDVADNFATGVKLAKKNTDPPILTKAAVGEDGSFRFNIAFTDAFKQTAAVLKSAYATELNMESQVRIDGGEWKYWMIPDELYPYRVGERQFTISAEDAEKKVEFRCRLKGGNPDFGTDLTTGWSDIFTSENGKVHIAVNDDPFDEKVQAAQRAAEEKEAKKCKLCGFCPVHPFGICMFIWLGILALIALIVWYALHQRKKKQAQAAQIEARRAASSQSGEDKTKSFIQTDRITLHTQSAEEAAPAEPATEEPATEEPTAEEPAPEAPEDAQEAEHED